MAERFGCLQHPAICIHPCAYFLSLFCSLSLITENQIHGKGQKQKRGSKRKRVKATNEDEEKALKGKPMLGEAREGQGWDQAFTVQYNSLCTNLRRHADYWTCLE